MTSQDVEEFHHAFGLGHGVWRAVRWSAFSLLAEVVLWVASFGISVALWVEDRWRSLQRARVWDDEA